MAARKKPAPKRGASRYQAPAKKPVPGWIWLACGLVVGGFFMFLFSLEPGRDEIKRDKGEQVRSTKPEPKPTKPEPARPKYDFYTLLPESEVILPQALEETPPPAPEPKPVTPEEAAKIDTARAEAALNGQVPPPAPPVLASAPVTTQIILLGQNVRVETGKVREETWHRVLVGPFASREQLAAAQKTLAGNGYSNLLLQQRQVR
jgi:cell division protein FtsN